MFYSVCILYLNHSSSVRVQYLDRTVTLADYLLNHKPGITSLPSTLDKPNGCDVTASRSDLHSYWFVE